METLPGYSTETYQQIPETRSEISLQSPGMLTRVLAGAVPFALLLACGTGCEVQSQSPVIKRGEPVVIKLNTIEPIHNWSVEEADPKNMLDQQTAQRQIRRANGKALLNLPTAGNIYTIEQGTPQNHFSIPVTIPKWVEFRVDKPDQAYDLNVKAAVELGDRCLNNPPKEFALGEINPKLPLIIRTRLRFQINKPGDSKPVIDVSNLPLYDIVNNSGNPTGEKRRLSFYKVKDDYGNITGEERFYDDKILDPIVIYMDSVKKELSRDYEVPTERYQEALGNLTTLNLSKKFYARLCDEYKGDEEQAYLEAMLNHKLPRLFINVDIKKPKLPKE